MKDNFLFRYVQQDASNKINKMFFGPFSVQGKKKLNGRNEQFYFFSTKWVMLCVSTRSDSICQSSESNEKMNERRLDKKKKVAEKLKSLKNRMIWRCGKKRWIKC